MKKLRSLLILLVLFACDIQEQSEINIAPQENQLFKYSEGIYVDELMTYPKIPIGGIFNFYVNAIMFNSDGTYDLYFGGYEDNPDYQKLNFTRDLHWSNNEGVIEFETGREDNYVATWTIKKSIISELVVTEKNEDGNHIEYTLISN